MKLWKEAVDQNSAEGKTCLFKYYDQTGQKEKAERAAKLLQEAADSQNANAKCELGIQHSEGSRGFTMDTDLSRRLWRESADLGNPKAMWLLGKAASKQNSEQAKDWFRRGREFNHIDSLISLMQELIKSASRARLPLSKEDATEAFQAAMQAANQGDLDGMNCVAILFKEGIGCKKDQRESARWFRSCGFDYPPRVIIF